MHNFFWIPSFASRIAQRRSQLRAAPVVLQQPINVHLLVIQVVYSDMRAIIIGESRSVSRNAEVVASLPTHAWCSTSPQAPHCMRRAPRSCHISAFSQLPSQGARNTGCVCSQSFSFLSFSLAWINIMPARPISSWQALRILFQIS